MTATGRADGREKEYSSLVHRALDAGQDYFVVWSLAAVVVILSIATSTFTSRSNLLNLADSAAYLGLIACSVTVVMVAGAFDLSVGAIFALTGVVAAQASSWLPGSVALLVGVGAGAICGLMNGSLVSFGRVHPILATLATTVVFNGVAVLISQGYSVRAGNSGFTALGTGRLFGLTHATWIFITFAALCTVLLQYTSFGRQVFATGSNPRVARYSGVRPEIVALKTYVLSGVAASLAGVLAASSLGQGQPGTGTGFELLAIAAVAVGGSSVMGGEGAIWRTVVGVTLLRVLNNGFNLLGVEESFRQIVTGFVIIAAVSLDVRSRSKRGTLRI